MLAALPCLSPPMSSTVFTFGYVKGMSTSGRAGQSHACLATEEDRLEPPTR
jgi:hypothetical protein